MRAMQLSTPSSISLISLTTLVTMSTFWEVATNASMRRMQVIFIILTKYILILFIN